MSNIVKRQFEDQIRFLLLQFPLDVGRVANDASEYFGQEITVDQVVRVQRKMKSQQDHDTAMWVASNISQKLFQGIREREAKLEAMFATWAGAERGCVSVCCGGPVEKKTDFSGNTYHFCLVCCQNAHIRTARYPEIEKLKMQIIREMRKETELMIKFAKDLGFTAKGQEAPKEVHQHTNFVVVGGGGGGGQGQQGAVPIDADAAKRIEDMSPSERERVIKTLERMSHGEEPVVDAEFVAEPKEGSSGEEAGSN